LANVAVILAFRLPDQELDLLGIVQLVLASVSNGGLSAILTLGGFFLLGSVFDITTPLRLMELARPTHPLLRQLLLKAPGTYHHSLLVSNMAEQAAEQIGADALLSRVGAYYHDIGKTVRPYFFVENQADGINVHDRLDPKTSAQIIVSHTKDGLDLARKYRLPGKIQEFIAQHHGVGTVSYFYQQALQHEGGAGTANEDDFRYPGPRPLSKEVAIVMLADGCESAVRSARPTSAEEIDELVRKVINDRLLRGELDDSDLTLRDLDKIREAFTSILQGVFHPRIKYPEGALKELEPAAQGDD
jgi:putative nucleotidyltransferase with HDIG domain